jgi:hypothetical protein
MSQQPPGSISIELVEAGIRLIVCLKSGDMGFLNLPLPVAEDLGEGLILAVREFERYQSEKMGWDVT